MHKAEAFTRPGPLCPGHERLHLGMSKLLTQCLYLGVSKLLTQAGEELGERFHGPITGVMP